MDAPRRKIKDWCKRYNTEVIDEIRNSTQVVRYRINDGKYKGFIGKSPVRYLANAAVQPTWRSLPKYSRAQYIQQSFEKEGLLVLALPISLATDEHILAKREIDGYVWKTTLNNFELGNRPKVTCYSMSRGEAMVADILKFNGIDYIVEHRVEIEGGTYRFDFYLPKENIFIEYHGIQHFEEVPFMHSYTSFEKNKYHDKVKKIHAESAGTYLMIPYTDSTLEDITKKLSEKIVGLCTPSEGYFKEQESSRLRHIHEIAEYYHTHTEQETYDKFKVSKGTINRYYKAVYGLSRMDNRRKGTQEEIAEFSLYNSLLATRRKYSTSTDYIYRACREVYGKERKDVILDLEKEQGRTQEDIAKYILENSFKTACIKYSIGLTKARKCFSSTYGMSKTEYLAQIEGGN